MTDLIIVNIGVDLCLNCPYDDCVSTDLELCDILKAEVKRAKRQQELEQQQELEDVLHNISTRINGSGILLNELAVELDCEYSYLVSLARRGLLETKRRKLPGGGHRRIIVTGVAS
jgi:hypothetical protein